MSEYSEGVYTTEIKYLREDMKEWQEVTRAGLKEIEDSVKCLPCKTHNDQLVEIKTGLKMIKVLGAIFGFILSLVVPVLIHLFLK